MPRDDTQPRLIRLKPRPLPYVGFACILLFALAFLASSVIDALDVGFPDDWFDEYAGTEWAFVEYHADGSFTLLDVRPTELDGREVHIVRVEWSGRGDGGPARAWLHREFDYFQEPITNHARRNRSKQLREAIEAEVLESDVKIGLVVLNAVVLIPLIVCLPAAGVLLLDYAMWQSRLATRRYRVRNARCPKCVYDLSGLPRPHASCPECGCTWEPPRSETSGG